MTVIFFAGPRLDHGDADQSSSVEADYLERRDARPPVVVRGYGVSGHPVSVIRAGERVEDATLATAKDLEAYGFDPISISKYWLFPARDAYGNAITGLLRKYNIPSRLAGGSDNQGVAPPFSFRPSAVIPMANGWLFCLAAPLVNTWDLTRWGEPQYSGVFREYYRVYRRNGDWVQDFPDLHGAPIHDVHWDDDGNCFVAGDEVGEDRHSFRKYNSDYQLQWSVSFKDYWPLSTVAVRTSNTDFFYGRAQFGQRRASVRIEPVGDGSFYVLSEISYTGGSSASGFRRYRRRRPFMQIARVSAAGALLWVRVLQLTTPYFSADREPDRKNITCKALDTHQLVLFFRDGIPARYSVGEVGGDYVWDYQYQALIFDSQWTEQMRLDAAVDSIDWQNGMIVNAAGDWVGHLFAFIATLYNTFTASTGQVINQYVYPNLLIGSIMRYADERLTVWSRRIRWGGEFGDTYNIDPEYVKHVFYKDLTLLSEEETPSFNHLEPIALAEDGSLYRGRRVLQDYPGSFSHPNFFATGVLVAWHFQAEDADGDPLWAGISATARLGVNSYGKNWRDFGVWRIVTDEIRDGALPATVEATRLYPFLPAYQAAHDTYIVRTNAHGNLESGDLIRLTGGTYDLGTGRVDFWLPATDIVIAYDSPTPALALPVFLKTPTLIGPLDARPPGLALRFGLAAPFLRREYVGPLAVQVHRLTLGDLEIPFSHLSARKTAFETTVSAICPAASEPLVAAILARDTDVLTVWRGVRFPDGAEQLEPLLSGTLTGIRYDRGGRSGSITLDLRQEPAATPARTRTLTAPNRRDARSWSSPLPDVFLNPGDTAVVGSESFTVGTVEYSIGPREARMTVGEAEE